MNSLRSAPLKFDIQGPRYTTRLRGAYKLRGDPGRCRFPHPTCGLGSLAFHIHSPTSTCQVESTRIESKRSSLKKATSKPTVTVKISSIPMFLSRALGPSRLSNVVVFPCSSHVDHLVRSSTFARKIIENHPFAKVYMVDIGAQDHPIPGAHQKNAIKSVISITLLSLHTESHAFKVPKRHRCLRSVPFFYPLLPG